MPAPKTAKQRSEALAAYKAGDPAAEIIATHKICHATLYQWVREAGIPLRVPHKTIAVRETVLAAYKAGDAVAGLALEHGIGEPAIYHWIKQAGIPLRSRRHESAEKTRAIELLTAQGERLDFSKAVRELGIPRTTLRLWWRQHKTAPTTERTAP